MIFDIKAFCIESGLDVEEIVEKISDQKREREIIAKNVNDCLMYYKLLSPIRELSFSDEERAKYALYMSMALDKNYIDKTDFEVLQPAIDYFENHGSATDKLRTFYYQGRIYFNIGESEKAMKCLVKSIDLGSKSNDLSTKARNYNVQGLLYSQYYNWEKYVQCCLAAAQCYKSFNNTDAYVRMLCKASEGYVFIGNKEAVNKTLLESSHYWLLFFNIF